MKTATLISAMLATAVAVTGTSVLAKGQRDRQVPTFQELDADGDGQVTQAELEAHRNQRYTQADSDGDGQISVQEMQAAAQQNANERVTKMFEKLDANQDGFLSDDELPKPRRGAKMFERIDADGNGAISEQEYADARDKMGRKHKRQKRSGGDSN